MKAKARNKPLGHRGPTEMSPAGAIRRGFFFAGREGLWGREADVAPFPFVIPQSAANKHEKGPPEDRRALVRGNSGPVRLRLEGGRPGLP